MDTLKTNRNAALYATLTVVEKFLPIIAIVAFFKKLISLVTEFGSYMGGALGYGSDLLGAYSSDLLGAYSSDPLGAYSSDLLGAYGLELLGIQNPMDIFTDVLKDLMTPFIIAAVLLIAYLVYEIVLFSGVFKDVNTICGRFGEQGESLPYIVVFLLSAVTLNIYNIVWSRQQGKRLENAAGNYQIKIRGSSTSHTVFSVLHAISVWIFMILIVMAKTGALFEASFVLILILLVAVFILSFMVIGNMFSFIKDVNALAGVYNGQPVGVYDSQPVGVYGGQPSGYEGAGAQAAGQFAQPAYHQPGGDNDYTMPVEEWAPNGGTAYGQNGAVRTLSGSMQCCKGLYEGAQFPIEGETVIGRDELSANIVIKDPGISRKHCGIRFNPADGTYMVTDYSSNGIFYKNGQRFPQNVPVACSAGTILVIAQSGNEFLLK